jgi:hypothetical protein
MVAKFDTLYEKGEHLSYFSRKRPIRQAPIRRTERRVGRVRRPRKSLWHSPRERPHSFWFS